MPSLVSSFGKRNGIGLGPKLSPQLLFLLKFLAASRVLSKGCWCVSFSIPCVSCVFNLLKSKLAQAQFWLFYTLNFSLCSISKAASRPFLCLFNFSLYALMSPSEGPYLFSSSACTWISSTWILMLHLWFASWLFFHAVKIAGSHLFLCVVREWSSCTFN